MPNRQKKDAILSPELLKIIKIFGLISLGIVLILSFFNTRRANNTGEDQTFKMSASDRLYFLNVRALSYEREVRKDAQMTLFRHDDRLDDTTKVGLDLVLILNPLKDEAYLNLEPRELDWPIEIKIDTGQPFILDHGNKWTHLENVSKLRQGVLNGANFYVRQKDDWFPFWDQPGELDYLRTVLNDYEDLVN